MTTVAREEYVTDVPYLRSFVRDLSPLTLRLVAALNGFPTPPRDDFDYCELGSAHGDTTATLAAAYPHARFLGVDINPQHIASAHHLAAEGGSTTSASWSATSRTSDARRSPTSTSSPRTAS